jgi:type II secretory pathway pseudopilin PulG
MKSLPLNKNYLSPDSGFSLTEALVGFTIATGLVAAIAPLVLIAVSTRLYNYRVEQATQLAQTQINRIQTLMAQGVKTDQETQLPPATAAGVRVSQVGVPTVLETSLTALNSPTEALEVDTNNDGQPDYLVQMFRDQGLRFTDGLAENQLAVFRMGIRVYSGLARDNLANLSTNLAPINLTQGIGQQRTRPLAVLYTEISVNDLRGSLTRYRDYLASPP